MKEDEHLTPGHDKTIPKIPTQITYSDLQFKDITWKRSAHMIVTGNPKSGKSSVIKSLISGTGSRVKGEQKTDMWNVSVWKTTPDTAVAIYDIAGAKSFSPVIPCLIQHLPKHNSFAVIVHHIMSEDYLGTFMKMKELLMINPFLEIVLILSQSDRTIKFGKIAKFKREIRKLMKAEKRRLEDSHDFRKRYSPNVDCAIVEHLIGTYKNLLADENQTNLVSCRKKDGNGLEQLSKTLTEIVLRCSKKVTRPQDLQLIGTSISKTVLQKRQNNCIVTLDECFTSYSEIAKLLHKISMGNTEDIIYALVEQGKVFIATNKTLSSRYSIFSQPAILIEIMKSFFSKNLGKNLDFSELSEYEKKLFQNRRARWNMVNKNVYSRGILHVNLLRVILVGIGVYDEASTILTLLENLDLGVRINEDELFFPWYVDSWQTELNEKLLELTQIKRNRIYWSFTINGNFTQTIFYRLCILIMKTCIAEQYFTISPVNFSAWKGGLYIELQNPIFLNYDGTNDTIKMILGGHIDSVLQHKSLWSHTRRVHENIDELKKSYTGLVSSFEVDCPHCCIEITNSTKNKTESIVKQLARTVFNTLPSQKLLQILSKQKNNRFVSEIQSSRNVINARVAISEAVFCEQYEQKQGEMMCGDQLYPAALIYPLPQGHSKHLVNIIFYTTVFFCIISLYGVPSAVHEKSAEICNTFTSVSECFSTTQSLNIG